jgi:hypothetical protein
LNYKQRLAKLQTENRDIAERQVESENDKVERLSLVANWSKRHLLLKKRYAKLKQGHNDFRKDILRELKSSAGYPLGATEAMKRHAAAKCQ